MVNAFRMSLIAAAFVGFAGLVRAEPVPPNKTANPAPASPEDRSPCTFDLDAEWLVPLKTMSVKTVRTNVPHPVNCEGAVIKSISATGKGSDTTLDFAVAYKPGHDRAGFVSFAIVYDNRSVGVGEAQDNLVAGAVSHLTGNFTIKSRDFDRIFASDPKPVLRITVRLGKE